MLRIPLLFLVIQLSLTLSCGSTTPKHRDPVQINDAPGKIVIHRCGRNCFNYLIETTLNGKTTLLYAEMIPDHFHEEGKVFHFTGELLHDMEQLYKPGADDRPIPDIQVQKVLLLSFRE